MNIIDQFSRHIVRLRYLWLVLAIGIIAIVAPGLGKLSFDSDARVFFAESNPDRIALDQFEAEFSKDDNIGIIIQPGDGKVFTPETLKIIANITEESWLLPYVRRVDSLTNFQLSQADGDDLTVRDLVTNPSQISVEEAENVQKIALADERLLHSIIPPSADVTVVQVLFRLPGIDLAAETPLIVDEVKSLVAKFQSEYPALKLRLTGSVMMNHQFAISGQQDGQTLTPAMLIAILFITALLYSTIFGAISALIVLALSAIIALGIFGHAGGQLNSISAISPIIIMVLTMASVGHILAGVQKHMKYSNSRKAWVYVSLKKNMIPLVIAVLTTIIGFLSLNFSISPPFRQLGNIVAIGLTASLFFTLFLLPTLVCILPMKRQTGSSLVTKLVKSICNLVIHRPKTICIATISICILTFSGIPRLIFEDDFVRYFDTRYELRRDMDFFEDRLGGHNALEFVLPATAEGGVSDPLFVANVASFTEWLRDQPEVTYVRSLTDTLSRINMNMHGDDPAYHRLPSSFNEIAQYLFLYELSLPYGVDLTDQINIDRSAMRITATMANATTTEIRDLSNRAKFWLLKNTSNMSVEPTGMSHVFSQISNRDVRAMLMGTVIALIGISILLLLIFRDIKLGFISLIPNLVPAAMAFGIWGFAMGDVTLAIAVVIAMTLGIVVDDTVHFLVKYKEGRGRGMNAEDSVRLAFNQSGTAIFVTSVAFILGFTILGQSGFAVNGDMARLTALTIGMALITDFLLLPSLLIIFQKGRNIMINQKTLATLMIVSLFIPLSFIYTAKAEEVSSPMKGLNIVKAADQADSGWHDYYAKGQMILRDASGRESIRDLESFNMERNPIKEGDWLVIVFSSPAEIKGTASLTHSKLEPANDDQWLYLPSNKRVKRISSSNRAGKFVSSEFSFEDLSSQEVADYNYSYKGTEPCPNMEKLVCHVIDSFPRSKRSGYSKRTLWIDTDAYRQHQIQFYNRRGALEKVLNSTEFNKYGDKYWRPSSILMKNVQTGKSTLLKFSSYQFSAGLTTSDFSAQRFKSIRK